MTSPSGSEPGRSSFRMTVEGTSLGLTRALVQRATAHLPSETGYRAALLSDEVVTNALLHGGGHFVLELALLPDRVRVAVTDGSPDLPEVQLEPPDREHGRGMAIVASLASDWGTRAEGPGKVVWFDLALPEP